MRALLSCFFVIIREVDLENVSPRVRWKNRSVCEHIDIRWELSCSRLWEFATPNSNTIIWKTKNVFLIFLFHFWNVQQSLNILEKNMIFIANVFPKLQTVKVFFIPLSKKRCFRTRFDSEHMKDSQILAKSPWEQFYHVFYHSQRSWFGLFLP